MSGLQNVGFERCEVWAHFDPLFTQYLMDFGCSKRTLTRDLRSTLDISGAQRRRYTHFGMLFTQGTYGSRVPYTDFDMLFT